MGQWPSCCGVGTATGVGRMSLVSLWALLRPEGVEGSGLPRPVTGSLPSLLLEHPVMPERVVLWAGVGGVRGVTEMRETWSCQAAASGGTGLAQTSQGASRAPQSMLDGSGKKEKESWGALGPPGRRWTLSALREWGKPAGQ